MKSDDELITFVYNMAGKILIEENLDFIDLKRWKSVVDKMDLPLATTYRIVVLNNQLMNGGILQYFDNTYAIFSHETVEDFKRIKALQTSDIILKCFNLVNPQGYKSDDLLDFVSEQKYEKYELEIEAELGELEDVYLQLENEENLELLLAKYLRQ